MTDPTADPRLAWPWPISVGLRHLRSVLLLAEEQHHGRAAARAGIEQSPFSRQIGDIEARLGVQLFQRSRRSTILTPVGAAFIEDVRCLFAHYEAVIAKLQALAAGADLPFRLGLAEGAAGPALAEFLRLCTAHSPAIDILLIERPTPELASLLPWWARCRAPAVATARRQAGGCARL